VLGLAIVFLAVVNIAVVVLARISAMVAGPVERLVLASRELAMERFDHRVQLSQRDEFDELARAFNALAEQLGANERRRLETLGQVSLALNHELNNAMAIIELQLRLIAGSSAGDAGAERSLGRIHQSLQRMNQALASLKHIRRIVLTPYLGGVKMLDLKRSAETGDAQPPAEAAEADWRGWL
jgi:signal transduction histidine kinase